MKSERPGVVDGVSTTKPTVPKRIRRRNRRAKDKSAEATGAIVARGNVRSGVFFHPRRLTFAVDRIDSSPGQREDRKTHLTN